MGCGSSRCQGISRSAPVILESGRGCLAMGVAKWPKRRGVAIMLERNGW
jgi:hypothetical protein